MSFEAAMVEVVWIRAADYDPSIVPGHKIRPDAGLPVFQVLDRRQVAMMFKVGAKWEVRPFTQLTLAIVEQNTPSATVPRRMGARGISHRFAVTVLRERWESYLQTAHRPGRGGIRFRDRRS